MLRQKTGIIYFSGKQQGFVLVLALVLLTVLTLIGVTAMNSANMEVRIAANASQHQRLVSKTESTIHLVTSSSPSNPISYQTSTPQSYAGTNTTASVQYVGCAKGIGSSLEEGRGFSYSFYQIQAGSTLTTGSSTSVQMQGARYPAAACTGL